METAIVREQYLPPGVETAIVREQCFPSGMETAIVREQYLPPGMETAIVREQYLPPGVETAIVREQYLLPGVEAAIVREQCLLPGVEAGIVREQYLLSGVGTAIVCEQYLLPGRETCRCSRAIVIIRVKTPGRRGDALDPGIKMPGYAYPAIHRRDTIHPDPNAMRVINSRGFQPTVRVGAIYYIRYRKRKRGDLLASPSRLFIQASDY